MYGNSQYSTGPRSVSVHRYPGPSYVSRELVGRFPERGEGTQSPTLRSAYKDPYTSHVVVAAGGLLFSMRQYRD